MFDYYRFRQNLLSESSKPNDPPEVVVFVYDDGRCRVQRRSYSEYSTWDSRHYKRKSACSRRVPYRCDRWYSSINDVFPLITAMTSNNRYFLVPPPEEREPARMSASERAEHHAHMESIKDVVPTMDFGSMRYIRQSPLPVKALF